MRGTIRYIVIVFQLLVFLSISYHVDGQVNNPLSIKIIDAQTGTPINNVLILSNFNDIIVLEGKTNIEGILTTRSKYFKGNIAAITIKKEGYGTYNFQLKIENHYDWLVKLSSKYEINNSNIGQKGSRDIVNEYDSIEKYEKSIIASFATAFITEDYYHSANMCMEEVFIDNRSPLAFKVTKKIIRDLFKHKSYSMYWGTEKGPNEKPIIYWTVQKTDNNTINVIIETDTKWLGTLVHRYLKIFHQKNCIRIYDIVLLNSTSIAFQDIANLQNRSFHSLANLYRNNGELADYYSVQSRTRDQRPSEYNWTSDKGHRFVPNDSYTSKSYPGIDYYDSNTYDSDDNWIDLPKPSAHYTLPKKYFNNCYSIGQVNAKISSVLNSTRYREKEYFYSSNKAANKFILRTKLELIDEEGWHIKWHSDTKTMPFSFSWSGLRKFMRSLIYEDFQTMRFLVFYYDPNPKRRYGEKIGIQDSNNSSPHLPRAFEKTPYDQGGEFNTDSYVTFQVFILVKRESEEGVSLIDYSDLDGRLHFIRSGIQKQFEAAP